MLALTSKQLKQYKDLGYVAPIDILSLEEVKKIKTELEYIEKIINTFISFPLFRIAPQQTQNQDH